MRFCARPVWFSPSRRLYEPEAGLSGLGYGLGYFVQYPGHVKSWAIEGYDPDDRLNQTNKYVSSYKRSSDMIKCFKSHDILSSELVGGQNLYSITVPG